MGRNNQSHINIYSQAKKSKPPKYRPLLASATYGILCVFLAWGTFDTIESTLMVQLFMFLLGTLINIVAYFVNSQFFAFLSFVSYFLSIPLYEDSMIYSVTSTFFAFFVFIFMKRAAIRFYEEN